MVTLSERLKAIANMVSPGLICADVGCDHAYLAIYLAENDIAPFVYATDINRGPIEAAKRNIEQAGLSDRIETILCSGLKGIKPGSVQSVIMAGMGGPLMVEMIREGIKVCDLAKELILEPQSDPALVRHYLDDMGFLIISEDMVTEENKFYPVIKCVHYNRGQKASGDRSARGGSKERELSEGFRPEDVWEKEHKELYYRFGEILLKEEHPLLREYLYRQRKILKGIRDKLSVSEETESVLLKRAEIERDLFYVEEALAVINRSNPVEKERVLKEN
ncbi:MAG: class I SAM-dependent methyltransferase [Lachnospiraceae bacterium]|nr:class I SAM-dependent methyltransferase [Lachnospiraceae bacterium]